MQRMSLIDDERTKLTANALEEAEVTGLWIYADVVLPIVVLAMG